MSNESTGQQGEPSKESACSNALDRNIRTTLMIAILVRFVAPCVAVVVAMMYAIALTWQATGWWVSPTIAVESLVLCVAAVMGLIWLIYTPEMADEAIERARR